MVSAGSSAEAPEAAEADAQERAAFNDSDDVMTIGAHKKNTLASG